MTSRGNNHCRALRTKNLRRKERTLMTRNGLNGAEVQICFSPLLLTSRGDFGQNDPNNFLKEELV
jgi:hypothetical protein